MSLSMVDAAEVAADMDLVVVAVEAASSEMDSATAVMAALPVADPGTVSAMAPVVVLETVSEMGPVVVLEMATVMASAGSEMDPVDLAVDRAMVTELAVLATEPVGLEMATGLADGDKVDGVVLAVATLVTADLADWVTAVPVLGLVTGRETANGMVTGTRAVRGDSAMVKVLDKADPQVPMDADLVDEVFETVETLTASDPADRVMIPDSVAGPEVSMDADLVDPAFKMILAAAASDPADRVAEAQVDRALEMVATVAALTPAVRMVVPDSVADPAEQMNAGRVDLDSEIIRVTV